MDVQLTAVLTERSDADAQKDQNTECQDNCRGEKRQQGCDGEDPRLFPSETGEKSNITMYDCYGMPHAYINRDLLERLERRVIWATMEYSMKPRSKK